MRPPMPRSWAGARDVKPRALSVGGSLKAKHLETAELCNSLLHKMIRHSRLGLKRRQLVASAEPVMPGRNLASSINSFGRLIVLRVSMGNVCCAEYLDGLLADPLDQNASIRKYADVLRNTLLNENRMCLGGIWCRPPSGSGELRRPRPRRLPGKFALAQHV